MTCEWEPGLTLDLREGSTLSYTMRWKQWLGHGVAIDSHTVTTDSGLVIVGSAASADAVTFQVTGINAGETKNVLVTIVTDEAEPQTDSRAITLRGIADTA